MSGSRTKGVAFVLCAAAVFVFAAETWIVRNFTIDDAYITLRYARNLAAGNGLVFNPGERAEGYSSFLWTVLLSVPHLAHVDAVVFAKTLGVLLTLVLLAAAFLLGARLSRERDPSLAAAGGAAAAFIVGTYHATAVHAVSGMETTLCALLLTAFVLAALNWRQRASFGRCLGTAALGLLLGLTRPEMNVAVIAAGVVLLRRKGTRRTVLTAFALGYLVPGAIYFIARSSYYGLPFPLPFYVKGLHGRTLAGMKDIVWFASEFVGRLGVLLVLGLAAGLSDSVVVVLAAIGALVAFFAFPDPIMNVEWRYLYPTVPLFAALASRGFVEMVALLEGTRRLARIAMPVALAVLALCAISDMRPARLAIRDSLRYSEGLARAHLKLGRLLRSRTGSVAGGDPLLTIGDAGAVPYLSGWRTIDSYGLNDVAIATSGRHDASAVMSKRPTLVVLLSFDRDEFRPRLPWEADLLAECEKDGWRRATVIECDVDYFLWCMTRPETHLFDDSARRETP